MHNFLEIVERLLGLSPGHHESLPDPLPSRWNALDVLVIDQPMPVDEHVPLLKHHEQTLPCVAVDQCGEPESRMFIEEIVGIVQPLEHAASGVPQHVDVGRYPLLELAPSEDLEEGDRALDRVGGDVAEDTCGARLLASVLRQRKSSRPSATRAASIDSMTVASAAREPQTGQKALAP